MTAASRLSGALAPLRPLSLDQVVERAELQRRVDSRYVVTASTAQRLVEQLTATHAVLAIDGARVFRYETVYFDSPSLEAYQAHIQRRRRRFKCRTRRYLDSGLDVFEVKLKGRRGETVKRRTSMPGAVGPALSAAQRDFLHRSLVAGYGEDIASPELSAVARIEYGRTTLVALDGSERVTIDVGLRVHGEGGLAARLSDAHAIVETKSAGPRSQAGRTLVRCGSRPVRCSKYCLAVMLTRPDVPGNDFRRIARRYFDAGTN